MPFEFNLSNQNILAFFDPLPGGQTFAPLTIKHITLWPDRNLTIIGNGDAVSSVIAGQLLRITDKTDNSCVLVTDRFLVTVYGISRSTTFREFIRTFEIRSGPGETNNTNQQEARSHELRAELFIRHHWTGLYQAIAYAIEKDNHELDEAYKLYVADLRLYQFIFHILAYVFSAGMWKELNGSAKTQTANALFKIYSVLRDKGLKTEFARQHCFANEDGFTAVLSLFVSFDYARFAYAALHITSYYLDVLLQSQSDKHLKEARGFHEATMQLAMLLIDIDGVRTKEELVALNNLKLLFPVHHDSDAKDLPSKGTNRLNSEYTLDACMSQLDELVGLKSVKQHVRELIYFHQNNQKRVSAGLKAVESSSHIVFTGNPGTGKTTVARIIGQIYRALGILSKGHFIEATRSDIVAGYIGQTALKMRELLDAAKGGVLFIDEAYSLIQGDTVGDQFSREAINEMLKYMEDNRTDIVIIAAGYAGEMDGFINSNPGLRSRFLNFIDFPDYDPLEMLEILEAILQNYDMNFESDADRHYYLNCFSILKSKGGRAFGNGRTVRSLFEKAIRNQARRLNADPNRESLKSLSLDAHRTLQTLTAADMPMSDLETIL